MKTNVIVDSETTKLHVDSKGEVWALVGKDIPASSHMSVKAFLDHEAFKELENIQLTGNAGNAELISSLYQRKTEKGLPASIKLCSPSCCSGASRKSDPKKVLLDIRRVGAEIPQSQGGLHEMSHKDWQSYELRRILEYVEDPDAAVAAYKQHPVYKYASFLGHVDHNSICILISIMLDPRWYTYIDDNHTYHLHKLFKFLGLDEKTQDSVHRGNKADPKYERCALVLSAWKISEKPKNFEGNFLWKKWFDYSDPVRADLRASQMFVSYFYWTWLNELTYLDGFRSSEPMFVPEYFFKSKIDVEEFKKHISVVCTT